MAYSENTARLINKVNKLETLVATLKAELAQQPTNKRKRKPCPNWKIGTTCYLCECDWWLVEPEFDCGKEPCDISVLGTASAVR